MASRLYVTCPSYAMSGPKDRAERLRLAQTWATKCGWDVVVSPLMNVFCGEGVWLPVEQRAEDMQVALQHEIIWTAHGGYGAIELVPTLLAADAPAKPPLLIGYSDISVFHACWAVHGWGPTVYGSLADSVEDSRRGESLRAFLQGEGWRCSHQSEAAVRVIRAGNVEAPIFAACLVVLSNLCGTAAMPNLRGKILAIEDIDERPYAIDFALHQLHLSGALDGVAGLIGGAFHHQPHADYGGPTVGDIFARWAERLQVPAIARLPFGHMDDPLVVPCGVPVAFEARADGKWSLVYEHSS